ncbi:hypothetical protein PsorP6_003805 [Peronosclerospora sorghi]|uniref:Uncharacterized protein n=1 Tax=Peronosclerospora sorghi TaxID=230839 RepID=A0ACC0VS29_9STRA|nr:hypothetical protein PsorP6_003805 [Peronosclerospora sorghi]
MTTKYEDMSVREHLVRKNQAMPLSTPIAMVTHYYPCIGRFSSDIHCQPNTCTLCPGVIEECLLKLLVGYNDAFLTREGFTGGLIVKNSWAAGPYQGSHSLAYWMQEVSDWDERAVCPNSYKVQRGVEDCLSEKTKLFADTNIQPLHLKCKKPELCRTDGDFTYFVRNATDWGDRMTVMCLWE